ncbi:Metallophosphoesterase [Cordyceps militaris CM01]|uniref:Metallophosphoesterase n=2 Tax=Cordyceps militaris TaxID=73501 RepID=G3J5R3_CORMM|nr:Metallophosphoesterase [Cordyceps militaris CM01]ATY65858.1 Metallophosphoesterase [Cordyceps militaris]EGX96070.1 Metallophosphoesterase [Cordyceps militaris CM01]
MMRFAPLRILLILLTRAAGAPLEAPAIRRPLTFDKNDNFQISVFEDLHFGENAWDSWGPEQDINSVKVLNNVLDRETPQLVVLNGDLITGENAFVHNGSVYIDQIVKPIVDRDLLWASTYGNHDSDFNLSSASTWERENTHPNCRTGRMVPGRNAGVSNYYLPVYPRKCCKPACAPELLLWFFDSRGGFYFQETHLDGRRVGQPGWVDQSVVDWFQQTNADLKARHGHAIPSLGFVHIPPYVFQAIQKERGRNSIDPNTNPGINDDYLLAPQAQGWCPDGTNDGSCEYGGQDIPFMRAIASTPGMIGLFSGHDHGDTWCYKWDRLVPNTTVAGNGVNLCFGQHSGYGGYGNWVRGARQIRVNRTQLKKQNNLTAETWIRLENGATVGSVMLNFTFNQDIYPPTKDDKTYCPTCNYTVITPHPKAGFANRLLQEPSHGEWVAGGELK